MGMAVICIFGDSITWGAYDLELGGWANRLKIYFDNKGDYVTDVYNLGVSGDNVSDVLKRFDVEAQARTPDTIILAIGINDSSDPSSPQGTNFSKFESEFKQLLEKSHKYTKRIIIVGLTNVDEESGNHGYKNSSIEKYDEIIKTISVNENLSFVDLFKSLIKEDLVDGLHPNANGHRKIFEKIKEFVVGN